MPLVFAAPGAPSLPLYLVEPQASGAFLDAPQAGGKLKIPGYGSQRRSSFSGMKPDPNMIRIDEPSTLAAFALLHEYGLAEVGLSSVGVMLGAIDWLSRQDAPSCAVCICADGDERYLDEFESRYVPSVERADYDAAHARLRPAIRVSLRTSAATLWAWATGTSASAVSWRSWGPPVMISDATSPAPSAASSSGRNAAPSISAGVTRHRRHRISSVLGITESAVPYSTAALHARAMRPKSTASMSILAHHIAKIAIFGSYAAFFSSSGFQVPVAARLFMWAR